MKIIYTIFLITFLFVISGCQTIEDKSKKETEELSKFIGQPETELRIVMGNPTTETKDNKGARVLIYKNKKFRTFVIVNNFIWLTHNYL